EAVLFILITGRREDAKKVGRVGGGRLTSFRWARVRQDACRGGGGAGGGAGGASRAAWLTHPPSGGWSPSGRHDWGGAADRAGSGHGRRGAAGDGGGAVGPARLRARGGDRRVGAVAARAGVGRRGGGDA